ncbi:MAG: alpha/beta fold hydrolase [Candidatus Riflebacteria bacterium]|nr:alpha/beta fold hydrolase [Candidatus Riflebacteria bacterium]
MFVEPKCLHLSTPFQTQRGVIISQPIIAYEDYGLPNGPVIFIAHGGLSNQHAAGRYSSRDLAPGWWDGLIGPEKAFDTNRFRIIATNVLGSMFGTTGPQSINNETGKIFGPDFPKLTLRDIVRFQKVFLNEIGVERLEVMAGPSMGSMLSLEMAASYPEFVKGVVAVATAGRTPPPALAAHHFMMNLIKQDQQFNAGWYGENKPKACLKAIYQFSRMFYGHEKLLRKQFWNRLTDGLNSQDDRSHAAADYLMEQVDIRIQAWDPNSIISLLSAINTHDLGCGSESYSDGVKRITCPLLLMNIDTDQEFQPDWAVEIAEILNSRTSGQATFRVLESSYGHLGCLMETKQMEPHIRKFMQNAQQRNDSGFAIVN